MKNPSLVSHKELAEAKLNTTKLHCECMLCKNNSWEKTTHKKSDLELKLLQHSIIPRLH